MRNVHGFRGGRFGLDAEQARKVFQESIQLIGIEARVFDDLADLETERQRRVVRSQDKCLRRLFGLPLRLVRLLAQKTKGTIRNWVGILPKKAVHTRGVTAARSISTIVYCSKAVSISDK